MVQAIKKLASAEKFAQSAPSLFANLFVVAMFLYYLDRVQSKDDVVIKQRIEQCRSVQAESNERMRELSEALRQQAIAFERLSMTVVGIK